MIKRIIAFAQLILIISFTQAQDTQFSTEYNMPNYLSPALAGFGAPDGRGTFVFRWQWPSLNATSSSTFIGVEKSLPNYNSGLGLYAIMDNFGDGVLRRRNVSVQYAYQVHITEHTILSLGLSAGFIQNIVDESMLSFPNQYNQNGYIGGNSGEALTTNSRLSADLGTGAVVFGRKYWVAFSGLHLNSPNVSMTGGEDILPGRFTVNAGYEIDLSETNYNKYDYDRMRKSIFPVIHYKHQGRSDQLDVGAYALYNVLLAGVYYRGIPLKRYEPEFHNHEALVFMIGYNYDNIIHISYSYDAVVSQLSGSSGGSHEINIQLSPLFSFKNIRKKRPQKRLPCPSFIKLF